MKCDERARTIASAPNSCLAAGVLLLALTLPALLALPVVAQGTAPELKSDDARTELKPFLGTWKASFQGKVFAILMLRKDRGDLAGMLNNFDLGWDKDGNLDDDTHIDVGNGPIFNVHLRDGYVYFLAVQKDQYSPSTEWRFLPKNAREGELTQLVDGKPYSQNGTILKPILMIRDRTKP